MSCDRKLRNEETQRIEEAIKMQFPKGKVEAYRYNIASIRVRVIDKRFRGKSHPERDALVWPLLESLPDETQSDITLLLLFTKDEAKHSMMNVEFEYPSPSLL